jgi:hypothetical protein
VKAAAVSLAAVLLLPVLFISAAAGALVGRDQSLTATATTPVEPAPWGSDVPPDMDGLYMAAATRFGVAPGLLRAVGKVECDHNRNPDCPVPNSAGALGPMQFLPATFAEWSWASGAAAPSIVDPHDAVFAAAAMLAADGARSADPAPALWSYNHSDVYVSEVLAWALVYGWRTPDPGVLGAALLHDRARIALRPEAARDVADGRVDTRLLAAVLMLATRHELGAVGPFVTGHSLFVQGTDRISNHALGRAVDLPVVDGRVVDAGNGAARALVLDALWLPADVRPDEAFSPWQLSVGDARSQTDSEHTNHVHLGLTA